jgi:hypothetical protein
VAQKHKFVLPVMLVVASIGFFALMATQNSGIVDRASTLSSVSSQPSVQGRIQQNWAGAMQMIRERPLTGWGAGQFPVYQLYFTQSGNHVADGIPTATRVSLSEQAHNFYLQTAAELGLPGLLLMLGVLGSFLVAGLHRVDKMDSGIRQSLLMGSMAAVVAFAVDAVGSPSWQFGQVSMFLWLMLGVGVSCIRPRVKAEEAELVLAPSPRMTRPFAVALAGVALLAMLSTYNHAGAVNRYERKCQDVCEVLEKDCYREAQSDFSACQRKANCANKQKAEERNCPRSGRARSACLAKAKRNRTACERPCLTLREQARSQCANSKKLCNRTCIQKL